jgi:hypothetical protein
VILEKFFDDAETPKYGLSVSVSETKATIVIECTGPGDGVPVELTIADAQVLAYAILDRLDRAKVIAAHIAARDLALQQFNVRMREASNPLPEGK